MSYLSQDQVHHTAPQEQDPCTLATGGVFGCGRLQVASGENSYQN